MKKTFFILVVVCCVLLGASLISAQQKTIISAKIPFEFYVDNLQFPPGTYYFETVSGGPNHNYLRMVGENGMNSRYRMTSQESHSAAILNGSVRFLIKDGKAYLQQVLSPGDDHAHIMAPRIIPSVSETAVGK